MLDTKTIRDEIYALLADKYERVMSGQKEASDDEMTLILDDSAYRTADIDEIGPVREVTVRLRVAVVEVNEVG